MSTRFMPARIASLILMLALLVGVVYPQTPSVVPAPQTAPQAGADSNEQNKFKQAFLQLLNLIAEHDFNLRDSKKREAWIKEWTPIGESSMIETEEGLNKVSEAMLNSTGHRFNNYFSSAETQGLEQTKEPKLIGVGVSLQLGGARPIADKLKRRADVDRLTQEQIANAYRINDDNPLVISEVFPGSSAEEHGLQAGDVIVEISGVQVNGITFTEARRLLRGQDDKNRDGSSVSLKVERKKGREWLTTTLTRQEYIVPVVNAYLLDKIAYVRIKDFMSNYWMEEVVGVLTAFNEEKIEALILDFRGNGGGRVEYAMALLQILIEQGTYLQTEHRDGDHLVSTQHNLNQDFGYVVTKSSDPTKKPEVKMYDRYPLVLPTTTQIVVLVDEGSYSASEMVATALQLRREAKLVGVASGGKGVGQRIFNLLLKRSAAITNFEFMPGGKRIDWTGSVPDHVVKQKLTDLIMGDPSRDSQLRAALQVAAQMIAKQKEIKRRGEEQKQRHETEWKNRKK